MIEAIGWIGSAMFCFCALPQVMTVYKNKHGYGLSWWFLMMWLIGEILCAIYTSNQPVIPVPLVTNYVLNLLMLFVIIYYKIVGAPLEISLSKSAHHDKRQDCTLSNCPNARTKDDN